MVFQVDDSGQWYVTQNSMVCVNAASLKWWCKHEAERLRRIAHSADCHLGRLACVGITQVC